MAQQTATITPKEYKEKYKDYLTVGKLKEYLESYPNDAIVVVERVLDVYYKEHGWETLKRPNPLYDGMENEYTAAWSPVLYEDKECFYIDLHY